MTSDGEAVGGRGNAVGRTGSSNTVSTSSASAARAATSTRVHAPRRGSKTKPSAPGSPAPYSDGGTRPQNRQMTAADLIVSAHHGHVRVALLSDGSSSSMDSG